MAHSDEFLSFISDEEINAEAHQPDKKIQTQSLSIATAYADHLAGLRNKYGDVLTIECGFVRNFDLNGAAGHESDRHCCILDVNLVGAMIDIASTVMSIPNVLSDVGDPDIEQIARVSERNWPMGHALVNLPDSDGRPQKHRLTLPKDMTRRRCAIYLQHVALDLLWRHEIAHALLGHVDYACANIPGVRNLHENSRGNHKFSVLPLEVEADKHALLACLDTASQTSAPFLPSGLELNANQRFRCTVIAATLIIWFWGYLDSLRRNSAEDPDGELSHPPPGLRIMQILTALWEYFFRITRNAKSLGYVVHHVHNDLLALSSAHPRFSVLNPEKLYSPNKTRVAAAVHGAIAKQRDGQTADLNRYRYLER